MTAPATRLALGIDIGGTSTRVLVIDLDGNRRGFGRGPGANLTSHSLDHALDAISTALADALRDVDPSQVAAAVVGSAGDRNLAVPEVADAFADRWRQAGLTCPYDIVADALVAFVAGTASPDGTLVLSGTGSLAARADGRRLVHIADAHGWLLGDFGSGFWLGREAVRAALAALDQRETPGRLGRAVLQTLVGDVEPGRPPRETASDLVLAVHSRPPVTLSELAPLVNEHADNDPEARRILHEAADHLLRAAGIVRPPTATSPLVLAGSLLTTDTALAKLVVPRLSARWPQAVVSTAQDAVAGAAWLAGVTAGGLDDDEAVRLHRVLLPAAHTTPARR